MKPYPIFTKRKTHDLNQIWDFVFLDELPDEISDIEFDDRLPVPSAFDAFPAYAGKRGVGVYRCFIDTTPSTRALLKIGGAGMTCEVRVDGESFGKRVGAYTPFELMLPATPRSRREIMVITDNRYNYERCPLHENFFDFYNYGGIIRQVFLEELPVNPIRGVQVVTEDLTEGRIRVKTTFYGDPVPVTYRIDDGPYMASEETEFTALVPNPVPWSPDSPNLRLLTVDSGDDAIVVRFGLRQVGTDHGRITLNGSPVKLFGYCRHEGAPQFGPASPDSLMVADLQLLREMGCNFIRGAHYQQDPRFLDLCDEFGFLVFSESLGWGQDETRLTDSEFVKAQLAQTKTMVETDFNHPCVIMWGFLNEGASDKETARSCYEDLVALIRKLDPSRLVTYASSRCLDDLFLDQLDVICFNFYPGWYARDLDAERPLDDVVPAIRRMIDGLKAKGLGGAPFVITEIGAGAIYGWRDQHNDCWSEEYQAELLALACSEMASNDDVAGFSIWQFCDCRTYQGVRRALFRPRGFNNKGTLDEYRRPKKAYEVVRKIIREKRGLDS